MRTSILLLSLFLTPLAPSFAQLSTSEDLDVNNIRMAHLVHGDMWWNPLTAQQSGEFPKGSGQLLSSGGFLWMGGYGPGANLHVSAQAYRQSGNDYWPGPKDTFTLVFPKMIHANNWGRIWKIDRSQLDSFLAITSHTVANTPKPILEWPAKGNPYAAGRLGVPLVIQEDVAPFVDVNNDGLYNPLSGDYPEMKGDQMLWWIINDSGPNHLNTMGTPFGVEIRNTAWAYKRNTIADNILFYEFKVTNKSGVPYTGVRFGFGSDMDLGYAFDDYVGFDSGRRMGVYYNGSSATPPPMAGITMLELPGDAGNNIVPAGSFMSWDNNMGPDGNPESPGEYNYLLHATNRAGTPLPNNARYRYGRSTECDSNHPSGDRRMVIASGDFNLAAGASVRVGMALVIAPTGGSCPNLDFTGLNETADTAWALYRNPPVPTGIQETMARKALRIYPNPAQQVLYVEPGDSGGSGSIAVYDAVGRSLTLEQTRNGGIVRIATGMLAPGVYTIVYRGKDGARTNVFVKE